MTPEPTWLSDPARVFPITIDPSYDGYGYVSPYYMDTFAKSSSPNTNYTGYVEYGAHTNQVGYNSFPSQENYTYLYEDLNFLNGKQILDARFRTLAYTHSSSVPFIVHPVSPSYWDAASLTWNNKPGHRSDSISLLPASNTWTNADMTTWVANWTNGAWSNAGISIDTGGQNGLFRLSAMENGPGYAPYIHVTYNTIPSTSQPTARNLRIARSANSR